MKSKRKQLILVIVNLVLLLLVVAAIAVLIVRSDWRYGLFERFRGRNPVQPAVVQVARIRTAATSPWRPP